MLPFLRCSSKKLLATKVTLKLLYFIYVYTKITLLYIFKYVTCTFYILFQIMSNLDLFNSEEIANSESYPLNDLFYNTQELANLSRMNCQETKSSDRNKINAAKNKNPKKTLKCRQPRISTKFTPNLSYVSRKRNRNGHHLIKINISELIPGTKCRGFEETTDVQYIVEDGFDEIMENTENLVRKIVKKLSDDNIF